MPTIDDILAGVDWVDLIEKTNREFRIESIDLDTMRKVPTLGPHVVHEIAKRYKVNRTLAFDSHSLEIFALVGEAQFDRSGKKRSFAKATTFFSQAVASRCLSPESNAGNEARSAATKLLQFFYEDECCILDENARVALRDLQPPRKKKQLSEALGKYIRAWTTAYELARKSIDHACRDYRPVSSWKEPWATEFFKRRLFDKVLVDYKLRRRGRRQID